MRPSAPLTIDNVLRVLARIYPDAACTLHWTTPLDLLIATILSAQCTDVRVNIVTRKLFRKYRVPADYARVSANTLERDIRSCGTFRMKTRAIQESCRTILSRFGGEVPRSMAELTTLRGVGRKTAAVVLSTAFGIEEGIAVDTHVMRVSRRLGITRATTQGRIERGLMRKTPRGDWSALSHLLIAHGRALCTARSRRCGACPFRKNCPSSLTRGKRR